MLSDSKKQGCLRTAGMRSNLNLHTNWTFKTHSSGCTLLFLLPIPVMLAYMHFNLSGYSINQQLTKSWASNIVVTKEESHDFLPWHWFFYTVQFFLVWIIKIIASSSKSCTLQIVFRAHFSLQLYCYMNYLFPQQGPRNTMQKYNHLQTQSSQQPAAFLFSISCLKLKEILWSSRLVGYRLPLILESATDYNNKVLGFQTRTFMFVNKQADKETLSPICQRRARLIKCH